VDHSLWLLGKVNDTLYHSKTITHAMGTYISFMRNQSPWTYSKFSELKLKLNSARKLSVSDLTVVVSTTGDMTVHENNVQGHLLTS